MACAVWGLCGIVACRRFYFRAVRCLQRGAAPCGRGSGSVTCLVGGVTVSGNRGFGCEWTLRRGTWLRRGLPAGPYPVALIAWRPSVTVYDPGVRGPGLALVGDAGIWHAASRSSARSSSSANSCRLSCTCWVAAGRSLRLIRSDSVTPGTFAILSPPCPRRSLLTATLVACPRAGESSAGGVSRKWTTGIRRPSTW